MITFTVCADCRGDGGICLLCYGYGITVVVDSAAAEIARQLMADDARITYRTTRLARCRRAVRHAQAALVLA